jgi:hypothetical protein
VSPYIVTTKRRCDQPACDRSEPCSAERSGWCAHPNSDDGDGNRTPVSRRAVATLKEAEAICDSRIEQQRDSFDLPGMADAFEQVEDVMEESGGTVGPLPDGTVIEVEPTTWLAIAETVGMTWWSTATTPEATRRREQAVLDAYNARQA